MTKYINEQTHIRQIPEGMEKPNANDNKYWAGLEESVYTFFSPKFVADVEAYEAAIKDQPTFLKIGDGWEKYGISDTVDGEDVKIELQFYSKSHELWLEAGDWVTTSILERDGKQHRHVARLKHKEAGEESDYGMAILLLQDDLIGLREKETDLIKRMGGEDQPGFKLRQDALTNTRKWISEITAAIKLLNSKTINP